ncbi:hypothetical protein [uncultured Methanomethylovorans sp.]|uniref:hypothetical protein n=1 Tax=uncultured Methanomethylovorans sp. TaxID=183759 RepID=UPI002AA6EA88|nr:hypothetical protein [uncultured Methanomethylovorans sp.]
MFNMTIVLAILAVGFLITTLLSVAVNVLFVFKFPFILKSLFAQRLVFFCGIDGSIRPEPARVEGYGMRTDTGTYNFEREDVVTFYGIPSILVYRPIARAIRPNIAPIFRKLKRAGIKNKTAYASIIDSKRMSLDEFKQTFEVVVSE